MKLTVTSELCLVKLDGDAREDDAKSITFACLEMSVRVGDSVIVAILETNNLVHFPSLLGKRYYLGVSSTHSSGDGPP